MTRVATLLGDAPIAIAGVVLQRPSEMWVVEDRIGQLCADGALRVLDGVACTVLSGRGPDIRPLRNVPREAALPMAAWTAIIGDPEYLGAWPTVLGPVTAVGSVLVLVFCVDVGPDLLLPLLRLLPTTLDWASYDALRDLSPRDRAAVTDLTGGSAPLSPHLLA